VIEAASDVEHCGERRVLFTDPHCCSPFAPPERANKHHFPKYEIDFDMRKNLVALTGQGRTMIKVLDGVRVVEMGTFITGPAAAMYLADMGADVIKGRASGDRRSVPGVQGRTLQPAISRPTTATA